MMESRTMFGVLLEQIRQKRKILRDEALRGLYKRNNISLGMSGYKIEESKPINLRGVESVEYRLYKLIDCSVVTISSEIKAVVETGLRALPENKR